MNLFRPIDGANALINPEELFMVENLSMTGVKSLKLVMNFFVSDSYG